MPNKRIVIVDDQATARAILKGIVQEAGFKVVGQAANAEQTLAAVETYQPRFVFCDIQLKKESGLDILTELRKTYPDIHVVMVTGDATKNNLYEVVEGGAHAFIAKPVTAQSVLGAIERCEKQPGKTLKEMGVKIDKPGAPKGLARLGDASSSDETPDSGDSQ